MAIYHVLTFLPKAVPNSKRFCLILAFTNTKIILATKSFGVLIAVSTTLPLAQT